MLVNAQADMVAVRPSLQSYAIESFHAVLLHNAAIADRPKEVWERKLGGKSKSGWRYEVAG